MNYNKIIQSIPNEEFDYGEEPSIILVDSEGKRWFLALDIALALGYSRHREAIKRHVNSENLYRFGSIKNKIVSALPPYISNHWLFLSEKGLYDFIKSSNIKPKALELKDRYFEQKSTRRKGRAKR